MNGRRSEPLPSPDLAHQAETLIRSLNGVAAARVRTGARGIDSVEVTARDDQTARFMAAHVRSALLAGLATPLTATRIHVRVQGDQDAEHDEDTPDYTNGTRNGNSASHTEAPVAPPARDRVRLLHSEEEDEQDEEDRAPRDTPLFDPPAAPGHSGPAVPSPGRSTAPTAASEPAVAPAESPRRPLARPRLVAVDVDRPGDGRVRVRVSVAYGTVVHRAEAVAVDLPGAAAQAAAQAAVRALVDAGLDGVELNGLREVEIAGREYVLVALRKTDTSRRHRSGSAPIIGSPERSAAEAAVAAASELI